MTALVSHTGAVLDRPAAFQFALDPTAGLHGELFRYAGASRAAYNQCLAHTKTNYLTRKAEQAAGVSPEQRTAAVSWSKFSLINYINAYKNGTAEDAPTWTGEDGTEQRGWGWAHEVSADVFETAAVDAAAAHTNAARTGHYPRFKAKHRTVPSFRLRNRAKPGATSQPVRVEDVRHLRLPRLGNVKLHGSTKRLRRAVQSGRFHIQSVTVTCRGARWWVTVTGVAAAFHPHRRLRKPASPVGVDLGVSNRVVAATADRTVLYIREGVNITQQHAGKIGALQKRLARTKPGSLNRRRITTQIAKIHRRVRDRRRHLTHQDVNALLATGGTLVIEDLNVTGMVTRPAPIPDPAVPGGYVPNGAGAKAGLNRAIHDAGMADLRRILTYKATWYGAEVHVADRWFASTKTCSGCGHVTDMPLGTRTYTCTVCGLEADRDVNAAANLASWPEKQLQPA